MDSVPDARFSGDRKRGEEREQGVEEKKGDGVKHRENGVSFTAVIRIHFVEMVPRFREPASSLVLLFMIF